MTTQFLDMTGLAYFKQKSDAENEAKFVKNSVLDDLIDNKLTAIYTYKGSVASTDLLPTEDNKVGDVYDVAGGMNYAWDGSKWDSLGDSKIAVDSALDADSTNPVENKVIFEALSNKADVSVASDTEDGLMSAADKEKLDGIVAISDSAIDSMFE